MKKKFLPVPACPDPAQYVLVTTKTKKFWRLKRGTHKPAVLNEAFAANAGNMSESMPAAAAILRKFSPYTERFSMSRNQQRIAALLNKSMRENGKMNYNYFIDFEMQKEHPFKDLYDGTINASVKKNVLTVTIPVVKGIMKVKNTLVTEFYFELILLTGDPAKEKQLRTESELSSLYQFKTNADPCVLSLQLPDKKPYAVFLKAGCMEGKQIGMNSKLYGMRVLGVG